MKRLALALCLAASPLAAQETPAPEAGEGTSLMEEGAKLFFRGLMYEMEPALNDMQSALDEIGPKLEELKPQILELIGLIDDFRNYHPPEKLPNGDILIRRKTTEELEKEQAAPVAPPVETEL
jgi:hypothetical protein